MRNGLMGLVGVVLAGCAPVGVPKEAGEHIRISKEGSMFGEEFTSLYPDGKLVETGWKNDGTALIPGPRNFRHTEQLRNGAFKAVLDYLGAHPFQTNEDPELPQVCDDRWTIEVSYIREGGAELEYDAPCGDQDIDEYLDKLFDVIEEYRVK